MSIVIDNVSKCFDGEQVLNGFSLTVKKGEHLCLMGKSGSGKTTLLNIILGFVKPDSGSIAIDSTSVSVVFQEDRLCEDFTALTNVRLACKNEKTATEYLTAVGLAEHLNKPVNELSGGMKRRVAIARALSVDADILILDEPFKGLDDGTKEDVIEFVRQKTKEKTLLFITHDAAEAESLGAHTVNI